MSKKNVLVFPCGSEIGLEIYKSIKYSIHFEVFGGSSTSDHGEFVYKNYIGGIPFCDDSNFIEAINEVIKKHKIEFIIPAHDSVVLELARAKEEGRINCQLITSPFVTCEVSRSKQKTYDLLRGSIATPKIYDKQRIKDSDFPIFLKPNVGQGSKGTFLVKDDNELDFYNKRYKDLLALEYLPGKEFTIDCFTNKNGDLIFCEGRERARITNGISVRSKTINDPRFLEIAKVINKKLMFRGVWFFQLKYSFKKELVLLEVAPRIAGTMGLARARGVNLVLLSLFDAMGCDIAIHPNLHNTIIDRALVNKYQHKLDYSHVYIDFDDLIIIDEKVNIDAMAFIYQAKNQSKKIYLITKHKDDIRKTLKNYTIDAALFNEIIHLTKEHEKSDFIKHKDSIFVDDSFAERNKVAVKLGIPVFDAHMFESLIE